MAGQNFYFRSTPVEKATAGATCDPQGESCAAAVEGELAAPIPLDHTVYNDGCGSGGDLHVVAYSADGSGEAPLLAAFCD